MNTAIFGAFARADRPHRNGGSGETIRESIPGKGKENEAAAREAHESVKIGKDAEGIEAESIEANRRDRVLMVRK